MNTESFLATAMAKRAAQGFRLTWIINAVGETFTAYPANAVNKAKMITSHERLGYELIDDSAWH